jgi:hypothetical protein
LPGSRIFAVGVNVIAWLTLPIFLIIDRVIKLKLHVEKVPASIGVSLATTVMALSAVASFFSLLGISSVTIREVRSVHIGFGILLIASLSVYFVSTDYGLTQSKIRVSLLSWALDFVAPLAFGISFLICKYDALLSVAGALQHVGAAAMFAKFLLLWQRMPRIGLFLAQTKQEKAD